MEAAADFAVSTILETLLGPIKRHIGYAFEFRSKVNALSVETSNLKLQRELLHDSIEGAQRRGEVVKPRFIEWQTKAENAIAEAEVVVRNGEETAQKSCSLCFNLKTRYRLGKKADQGMAGVVRLLAEKVSLGTSISNLPDLQQNFKPPVEGYEAQSRTQILNEVMDALLDPNITMVGLYGMGGIGKTTLAEEIHRQATAKSLFYKVVIVQVATKSETTAIQDTIVDFVIGSKLEKTADDARASELNLRLNEILKDKKILIILDDIWSVLDLDKVGIPTNSKGCKILITSRRLDLLSDMGSTKNFRLRGLSVEESMSLFKKKVTVVKDRNIAEEILDRCGGLPLLIVTIAALLKNKNEDLDAWVDVLTQLSKLDSREIENKVYSILELSYDRLPSEKSKPIFLLHGICSPHFKLRNLLWYSFGLGLFRNYTLSQARRHLKTLIGELKACSLLDIDEHGNVSMHDVVRDVAVRIACREGLAFKNSGDNELAEWPSRGDIINCNKVSMTSVAIKNLPENLGCPDVEFLLLRMLNSCSINIPDSAFQGTKQLKVVHFRGVIFASMPGSLCSLQNRHTLYLQNCKFPNLDAAIGQLESLEILSFRGSYLEALPSEVGKLTRLKLLDLSKCYNLNFIPANVISKLTSLEELLINESFDNWEIEDHSSGSNARLSELKCLSKLASLEVIVRDIQALPGSFFSMSLERYVIIIGEDGWRWNFDLDCGKTMVMKLDSSTSIDLLEKARNMLMEAEVVILCGIDGVTNLLNSEGFAKCKELSIRESSTLQQIVDCGTAVSFSELKELYISNCHELKFLFSVSAVRGLPQLKKIIIEDCNKMEALFVIDEESTQVVEFPCLRHLVLICLPQLKRFLDVRTSETASTTTKLMSLFNETVALPALEKLKLRLIDNIEMIWISGASGASGQLNSLTIQGCDKLQRVFPDSTQHSFHKLESLYISRCGSLKLLFPLVIAKTSSELKDVDVENCNELEEIVEAGEESTNSLPFHFFPQLTSLTLRRLQELRSLYPFGHTYKWPKLGKVMIRGCPKTIGISVFGEQGSPTVVGLSQITMEIVLKLNLHDDKAKQKAMQEVFWFSGVDSISMDMKDQKLTVTGDMDPVGLTMKLRKEICYTDILSIKYHESKKDDGKKHESKKDDDKKKDDQHFGPEFVYRQP